MDAQKKRDFDKFRMAQWLLLSVLAYVIATILADVPSATDAGMWPRVQTVLWKCGHLNLAAYLGYWIGRSRIGRLYPGSSDAKHIAHAIIIGATMLAFGLAL